MAERPCFLALLGAICGRTKDPVSLLYGARIELPHGSTNQMPNYLDNKAPVRF